MNEPDISLLTDKDLIHFIGIGGISMSGLAEIMHMRGIGTQGSDRAESHITAGLRAMGIKVFIGQRAENLLGATLAVYTAAAKDDNPEIIEAKRLGIPLYSRAELLGAIMKHYRTAIGVAGTHGKTTTTAILSHAVLKAGVDATISIGGELDLIGGNVRAGSGDFFITEACEYTNSFLHFFPTIAVITNIEEDHLDFFKDLADIKSSFRKFALLTAGKGCTVACGDDENVRDALSGAGIDLHYYGISPGNEYRADNIRENGGFPEFDVVKNDTLLTHIRLCVPGEHNIKNAVVAVAVCELCGLDLAACTRGIEEFRGTHRRFERRGKVNGAQIIDDYAHHPTEIKATLAAASQLAHNRLWCVFQPHTYSRTRTLWKEFTEAFDGVDELILTHIYPAREVFDGVTRCEDLAEDIKKRGVSVRYIDSFEEIEDFLKENLAPGDIAFTMGAGDVVKIADKLTEN